MAGGIISSAASEEAQKLRELFLSKHSDDIESGHYDDRDVEKLREDDGYVASFIRTYETLQDACDHLHESLRFRLEFGMNDLTPESFPLEMWESGAVYYHNTDKDGRTILYIQVKQHKKDPQILPIIKKFFAYMLEIQLRKHPNETIIVLLDMVGAGLAHLDLDFIKFIINCFKLHYPKLLDYMLLYEMPWLFNAAWKLIKQMLHAEYVKRIRFVTKSNIQEFINKDQLWDHMGGTNKFVYSYATSSFYSSGSADELDSESAVRKRVTFAEEDSRIYKSLSDDNIKDTDSTVTKLNGINNSTNGIIRERRGPAHNQKHNRASRTDNSYIGRLLTIRPAEELEFVIEDGVKEPCDIITLKNTLPYTIAYKVKTTSPEKYRVRPSSGLLKAGTDAEVTIHLQQGYQNTIHKDKFLIMAMEVANESSKPLSELWKAVQKDSLMEHRLRCIATSSKDAGNQGKKTTGGPSPPGISDLSKKVDSLIECNRRLQRTMLFLLVTQVILVTLVLVIVTVYWFSGSADTHMHIEDVSSQSCSHDATV